MNLAAARKLALALPGAVEAPHFHYTSFRVDGKIFATAPPAGEFLHVFVNEETRATAAALHPAVVDKLFWGGRVVGLKISLAVARPAVVRALLRQAWSAKVPKSLSTAPKRASPARNVQAVKKAARVRVSRNKR